MPILTAEPVCSLVKMRLEEMKLIGREVVLKNGYMKDSFTLEVVSIHVDDDTGNKENVSVLPHQVDDCPPS